MTRTARIPAWFVIAAASVSVAWLVPPPPPAVAAVGDIAQLSGTDGCVQNPPVKAADGCAAALGGSLDSTYGLAVTPDGKNVYGHGYWSSTVNAFSRNPATGALTPIQCIGERAIAGCVHAGQQLTNVYVVLATDQHVYTVGSSGIAEFARDASTGLLTYIGCIGNYFTCAPRFDIGNVYHGALSPDGRNLYTVGPDGSLTILTRDSTTGLLARRGCLRRNGTEGCANSPHLFSPYSVAVSPDGRNVYVSDAQGSKYPVIAYTRDAATGDLTELNCLNIDATDGCGQGYALGYFPRWTTVSPDGTSVYVADGGLGGIAVLRRSPADGSISQASGPAGCAQWDVPACAQAVGLGGVWGIQVSPDNRNVYAADEAFGNLLAFARDTATGALTQLTTTPCIGVDPCAPGRALSMVRGLAIAPDGKNVYTAAFNSSALGVFSRETPPVVIPDPGDGDEEPPPKQQPPQKPQQQPAGTPASAGAPSHAQRADQTEQQLGSVPGPTAAQMLNGLPSRPAVKRGRITFRLACPAGMPVACTGTFSLQTASNAGKVLGRAAGKARRRPAGKVLGRLAFTIPVGRSRALTIKLPARTVRTLARRRRLVVVAHLRLNGTASAPATAATRKLTLVSARGR